MASQSRSGGNRSSSFSLIQVLSSQNATLRDEGEAAPSLSEAEETEQAPPSQLHTEGGQLVVKRTAFYEDLLQRAKAGTASQSQVEEALNSLMVPDIDETGFLLTDEGKAYQDRINHCLTELASLFPNAIVDEAPLSFKVAMFPLFDALRAKRDSKIPVIANEILQQYAGQNFRALEWLRSLAARG
ncbi:MAG: hypothetical protein EP343_27345 [Deltaproteobacteria bacterium]|nr:MAG: hypothetical protein EP343_27345 [Deltaproteobacteria bacterium]